MPTSTVGWDEADEVAAWPGLPLLDKDVLADACVIGLGSSGLAAVDAVRARGLTVVGLDAGRVASGASGRNGGFLLGGPDAFLHKVILAWGEDAAVGLYRETLAELDRLAERLGDVVRRVGSIRLAGLPGAADCAELADCVEHENALRRNGIRVERYDGPLGRGLFLPDDAAINPALRAIRVAGQLRGSAALYEHTPVRAVRPGRVITAGGTVSAGVIVVAVDGRLEVLLPPLAGRVRTARLQMLATAPVVPGRLPCPVYARWGYDYAQQDPSGRVFCGGGRDLVADAEWTADARPTAGVQRYIEHAARRFAGEPVRVTDRWAASVAYTVGTSGRALCTLTDEGVAAVGGYNGTGNLVGPVAARAAVALLLDGTPPPPYFA